ncbi:hypothetical protein N7449_011946 [Penicillium cf. viridicatum]|uniref:Uncharacterized protein n=1 Tax=Penicillium cf. viridicatum TaxID=2972119 RepID=A0A9W9IMN4_9EURO|nr:hypothetical protein N7449_011946 [Penicillium cf. viridicatum]
MEPEVKAHPFFHDVKWHECLQRKSATSFKPHDASVVLWRDPYTYEPLSFREVRERRAHKGVVYVHMTKSPEEYPMWWLSIGRVNDKSNIASKKVLLNPGDDTACESRELTALSICLPVPRAVYVEVTAGLEEVVAERRKDRA